MNRKEFLRNLGLSSASLMAVYCLGSVTSCSPESENPTPTTPGGGGSNKLDFTLDLNQTANAALKANGSFVIKDSIIIARANDGSFVALSKACTHQGTTVDFQPSNNRFNCSNHGSNFNLDGSVANGPAGTALKKYNTTFDANTQILRVFE
ncbi:MAG: Rieske (2Fe-2S) protein [Verrucomicrobia bacterium]|nr:Rieske (2Fe-2S) protein [Cytophagales bacterium]